MSQKVLQISAEDAKYIDPNQVASITMIDGSTIYVQENVADDGFAEEAQAGYEQDQQLQQQQQQQQPAFRGVGTKIAAGLLATGAVVAGAAALGSALKPRPMIGAPMRGPVMMGPGMRGPGLMGPTMMRPGVVPMGRGVMRPMGRPMGGPMIGFRARRQDNTNEEEVCPYCHK